MIRGGIYLHLHRLGCISQSAGAMLPKAVGGFGENLCGTQPITNLRWRKDDFDPFTSRNANILLFEIINFHGCYRPKCRSVEV